MSAARTAGGGRRARRREAVAGEGGSTEARCHNEAIRVWARENGYPVSEQGRIPAEVDEACRDRDSSTATSLWDRRPRRVDPGRPVLTHPTVLFVGVRDGGRAQTAIGSMRTTALPRGARVSGAAGPAATGRGRRGRRRRAGSPAPGRPCAGTRGERVPAHGGRSGTPRSRGWGPVPTSSGVLAGGVRTPRAGPGPPTRRAGRGPRSRRCR
ncbi:Lsr2 family DNA-binding protein [Pseudonocardia alni]|uniref:Lsr2 family DNA-binding protein n=1 Tax=Pseudonocardia alni TaxID=33907 RepID=UPI001AD677DC|nr:hypothetical protein [Pseudonocardia alni]